MKKDWSEKELRRIFAVTRVPLGPDVDRTNPYEVWDAYADAGMDEYLAWHRRSFAGKAWVYARAQPLEVRRNPFRYGWAVLRDFVGCWF